MKEIKRHLPIIGTLIIGYWYGATGGWYYVPLFVAVYLLSYYKN